MAFISSIVPLAILIVGHHAPHSVAKDVREPINVDIRVGEGRLIGEGDRVTIQYRVCGAYKKELANSMKRGMPYTLIYSSRNSEPLVSVTLAGMHVGGSRYTVLPAESLPDGIGSIVPAKTDLTIWVHVIEAKTTDSAKVESPHVERAQGAVEVPRAVAHNGSARN
jgi:hypothetical protein